MNIRQRNNIVSKLNRSVLTNFNMISDNKNLLLLLLLSSFLNNISKLFQSRKIKKIKISKEIFLKRIITLSILVLELWKMNLKKNKISK